MSATPRKKPPYRDSKLTLMLKSSLCNDGLIAMIANVHPGRTHFEDSNNTLEYAKRASVVRASAQRRLSRAVVAANMNMTWPQGPLVSEDASADPPDFAATIASDGIDAAGIGDSAE